MNLQLHSGDQIRVTSDFKCDNFVDILSLNHEIGMSIDLYSHFYYIEIRKKLDDYRIFIFKNKSDKKQFDYGAYWSDSVVVFSVNNTRHS